MFDGGRERPSVDLTRGRRYLRGNRNYRGRMCTAGQEFVRIDPNGDVRRCGDGPSMGNLLTGPVQFADEATPCDRSYCFYFCEKFTRRAAKQEWEHAHPVAAFAKRVGRQLVAAVR